MLKETTALLLVLLAASSEPARILAFFPIAAKSHQFVFRPIIEELAKRGHEVVYYTGYGYDKVPEGIKQILLQEKSNAKPKSRLSFVEFGEYSIPTVTSTMYNMFLLSASRFLTNPKIQELIHTNETFDAILLESYVTHQFMSPLIHKFGAVAIEVRALGDCVWTNELSGLPDNPAYQMDNKNEHTNDLNFLDRLYNTYVTTTVTVLGYYYLHKQQALVDTYFNYPGWENRPLLPKLVANRSIILTNSHFAVGYPVPTAPHKKEIGGINVRPTKRLPEDLQTYMDQSKQGVIYMSLGSNIRVSDVANDDIREAFMSVFRELPYNVLMKWETDYSGTLPPNVKLSTWFPQQDILAHNNCVLFITHGGYLSISEAVHFGVPLVGIPFFGDQGKNLIIAEEAGYGRMLRYRNITRDTVAWTVNEVLSNKRYKEEAIRRSKIFRDRRQTPAEEAAYWVEYAIKYPNVLIPKGAWLSFVELHLIDVQIFLLAAVLLLAWGTSKLFYIICTWCESKPKPKSLPKKKLRKTD